MRRDARPVGLANSFMRSIASVDGQSRLHGDTLRHYLGRGRSLDRLHDMLRRLWVGIKYALRNLKEVCIVTVYDA